MNAYSKDLRLKVLAAVERGVPRREISDLLGISISTISRYIKLKASGEDVAPKPSPGRKAKILDDPDHKVKSILRKASSRTKEALLEATGKALDMITLEDIRGFYSDCGYRTPVQSF